MNSSREFRFLHFFGVLFHKRLSLKHGACVLYLQVSVSGSFNKYLPRKLYHLFLFQLKKFYIIGGLIKVLIQKFGRVICVNYLHEQFAICTFLIDLQNIAYSVSQIHWRVHLQILLMDLFSVLPQNNHIRKQYLKVNII